MPDEKQKEPFVPEAVASGQRAPPQIPDHELIRKIGGGSYGEVWLARRIMGTYRAVKVVQRDRFDHDRPFDREFNGIQRFEPISRSHESQVDILHVGRNEGCFYYVMELADDQNTGQEVNPATYSPKTLRSELFRRGKLPFAECLPIILSLTTALEHLHKHGLVHRDIKPSNIIFVHDIPKLADIGLVTSADATRSYVGTEGFLPPEGPGTPQADIYSLGKVLYEMVSGRDRQDFPELPTNLAELPDRMELLELNAMVAKACKNDPRRRYQSAAEMHADLLLLESGKSVRRLHGMERRLKFVTRVAVAIAAVMALGVVPYYVAIKEARHARVSEADAKEKLRNSYLALAKAGRFTHQVGRRFAGLEFLRRAAEIRAAPDLRNEAIACLALPDLRLTKELVGLSPGTWGRDFDFDHGRYVRCDNQGNLSVRWIDGDREELTLPGPCSPGEDFLVFSPNGRYLCAYHQPGRWFTIWDMEHGKPVLQRTNFNFRCVDFAPNSRSVVVAELTDPEAGLGQTSRPPLAHFAGLIYLYDLESGGEIHALAVPDLPGEARFDPSGQKLAVSFTGPVVKILDAASGQIDNEIPFPAAILDVAWHPSGKWLAAASGDSRIYLWDFVARKIRNVLVGHQAEATKVKFSQDGNWLASASWDGTFRLWDAFANQEILTTRIVGTQFRISSDDRWLGFNTDLAGKLGIWEAAGDREMRQLRIVENPIARATRSAMHPNGRLMATGYDDGVRLWNLDSGKELAFRPLGQTWDVAFEPDGKCFYTCTAAGLLQWPLNFYSEASTVEIGNPQGLGGPGTVLQVSLGHRGQLVFVQDGKVHRLDTRSKSEKEPFSASFPFTHVVMSPDGQLIIAWSRPPLEFQVLEVATGKVAERFEGAKEGGGFALFSPNGRWLALGHARGFGVFEVEGWKPVLSMPNQKGLQVLEFAFSPDSRLLAVAHSVSVLQLFDTTTWKETATLEAPALLGIVSLAFSPDGSKLAATCATEVAQVWNLRLIRDELARMNLDWALPPYPPPTN